MSKFSEILYLLDKAAFVGLRNSLGGGWVDDLTVLMGNLVFWTPLFIFLALYLTLSVERNLVLNLFFGLAAFVLSFQVAILLSRVFEQPAPYVVESIVHNLRLPAFSDNYAVNLPDWTVAAMVGAIRYTRLRLRGSGFPLPGWFFIFPLALCFARIIPGYAYPMDVITGWLIGLLIAFFMHHFARNVVVVMNR
jgi:membrane-associated phospholipid phosphatase